MQVLYKENEHKYETVGDESFKWISVTDFVEKFCESFDAEAMAESCAGKKKYKGMSKEDILKAWEEEGDRAREIGNKYHARREKETMACETISVEDKNLKIYRHDSIDGIKHSVEQKLEEGMYPEFLMYLKTAKLCGQADRVEVVNGKINIVDYKTSKKINTEGAKGEGGKKKMMYIPISHLEDCNLNHYQLQMSAYMYILLKHNPLLKPGTLEIHHIEFEKTGENKLGYPIYALDKDGDPIVKNCNKIECKYLKNEIRMMIEYAEKHPEILL